VLPFSIYSMEDMSLHGVIDRLEAYEKSRNEEGSKSQATLTKRERCSLARRLKAACTSGFSRDEFMRACAFVKKEMQRVETDPRNDGVIRRAKLQELLADIEAAPCLESEPVTCRSRGQSAGEVSCDIVGTLRVAFLGGDEFVVQLSSGLLVADVKASVAAQRSIPSVAVMHLLHQGRLLRNSEDASALNGAELHAVVTIKCLSNPARLKLQETTAVEPAEVGLLEVTQALTLPDMKLLAEILQCVQPSRLIISKSLTDGCLEALADYISIDLLQLDTFQIVAPLASSLVHVVRILRHCPTLDHCYLRQGKKHPPLTAENVRMLREEFSAQIVI